MSSGMFTFSDELASRTVPQRFARRSVLAILIVCAIVAAPASADRCNYGEHYTTLIRKFPDGSFAVQPPDREVDANGNIYSKPFQPLQLRGIGYSPTPIGEGPAEFPFGDYFTTYYSFMWKKDIATMKQLGANFVRVWSWDFFRVSDHAAFLDELYENGMYTMVPFQMGVGDGNGGATFTDLTNLDTRNQAKTQFRFVCKTVLAHPAVLGIFVANEPELSIFYANQLQPFYSLVNEFAQIIKEVDAELMDTDAGRSCPNVPAATSSSSSSSSGNVTCGHLISVPISATGFREVLSLYYDSTNIDFWSYQPYYGTDELIAQFNDYSNFTTQVPRVNLGVPRPQKKLFLSERGRSSRNQTATNFTDAELAQAQFLTESWNLVESSSFALGMSVMEYSDEWWKSVQSTLLLPGCPDYDNSYQSDCGFVAEETPTLVIVQEEHLGLFRQIESKPMIDGLIFQQSLELEAKAAANVLRTMWCPLNNGTDCTNFASIAKVSRNWNTLDRFPLVVLCVPILFVLIFALIISCCMSCRKRKANKRMNEVLTAAAAESPSGLHGEGAFAMYAAEGDQMSLGGTSRTWRQAGVSRVEGLPEIAPHALAPIVDHIAAMITRRLPRRATGAQRDDIHAYVACVASDMCETLGLISSSANVPLDIAGARGSTSGVFRSGAKTASKEKLFIESGSENFRPRRKSSDSSGRTGTDRAEDDAYVPSQATDSQNLTPQGAGTGGNRVPPLHGLAAPPPHMQQQQQHSSSRVMDTDGGHAPMERRVLTMSDVEPLGAKTAIEEACHRYFSACPIERIYRYATDTKGSSPNAGVDSMILYAVLRAIFGTVPHASVFNLRLFAYILRGYRTGHGAAALEEVLPWILQIYELADQQVISLEDLDAVNPFEDKDYDHEGAGRKMGNHETFIEGFQRSFHEKGSFCAPLVNFSFFFRYVLWMWFYAQASQPVQLGRLCAEDFYLDLALFDSFFMWWCFMAESYLLGGSKHSLWLFFTVLQAVIHFVIFAALLAGRYLGVFVLELGIKISLGNFGLISMELESIYLLVSILVVVIKMVGREWNMLGYGEHRLMDRSEFPTRNVSCCARFTRIFVLLMSILWVAISLIGVPAFGPANVSRHDGFIMYYLPWLILLIGMLIIHGLAEIPNKKSQVLRRHLGRSQGLPALFWTLTAVTFTMAMTEWVVPGVHLVTIGNVCDDVSSFKHLACALAVVAQWASAALISVIVLLFVFEAWKIIFGVVVGKMNGVGTAQSANDVTRLGPKSVLFPLSTVAAKGRTTNGLWAEFIRSMRREHLISSEEEQRALHFVDLRADDGTSKQNSPQVSPRSMSGVSPTSEGTARSAQIHRQIAANADDRGHGKMTRMHSKHDEEGRLNFENPEARRRVTYFVTSLRAMNDEIQDEEWIGREEMLADGIDSDDSQPNPGGHHRVDHEAPRDTLPHATVIVPLFQENVLFDPIEVAEPAGPGLAPIIELVASKHQSEFALFADELREEGLIIYNSARRRTWHSLTQYEKSEFLLAAFGDALPLVVDADGVYRRHVVEPFASPTANHADATMRCPLPNLLVHKVCLWVSLRGQTMGRTLRGLENVRRGMQLVDDIPNTVRANDKFQVIVGAQEFAHLTSHSAAQQRRHLTLLQREWNFDIVYDLAVELEAFSEEDGGLAASVVAAVLNVDQKCYYRADLEVTDPAEESIIHVTTVPLYAPVGKTKAYFSCHRRFDPKLNAFVTSCVQRPGPLLMCAKHRTQGKAENQFHCLTFARGEVTFALDMNQDFGLEEGFKMPMFLRRYFDKPQHAIVGFVEHCMTRDVSLVGEMQGAAEYAFVTIVNRTLARVLRMRLHYGHPDAFDGVRVRMVGGMSKASHNVNISEDVFGGFEAVARNSRVAYCEWLQAQKARDVFYEGTQTFNAKIHQGAAQQIRSRDVYFLCQRLPTIPRFSLVASAFGFYLMSAFFAMSIFLYTWSILLFAVSDVRFHKIGVFGGKIATAWLFQLGYFLVLPLFVENTIRYGIVSGVKAFFRTLIPSLFFHSSALLTGAYYVSTAMRTNQGLYLPTGRGFGLEQRSSVHIMATFGLSHMWPATLYTVLLLWFRAASPEDGLSYFLRTLAVWFMVLACFLSVHIFRVVPSPAVMLQDVADLGRWLWGPPVKFTNFPDPMAAVTNEQRKPSSYFAWRTAHIINNFTHEDKSTGCFVVVLTHLAADVLNELPVMVLLLSYLTKELYSIVLMVILIVLTAFTLRMRLYHQRTAHFVSVFELLLILVVALVLVIFFTSFRFASWDAVVIMGMTIYILTRLLPLIGAFLIRTRYLMANCCCCCGNLEDAEVMRRREKAASYIAFADAGAAALGSVIFFVLAFIASHLHNVFTAMMYNGGFVMRLSAYASRRKVTVRVKDE